MQCTPIFIRFYFWAPPYTPNKQFAYYTCFKIQKETAYVINPQDLKGNPHGGSLLFS